MVLSTISKRKEEGEKGRTTPITNKSDFFHFDSLGKIKGGEEKKEEHIIYSLPRMGKSGKRTARL